MVALSRNLTIFSGTLCERLLKGSKSLAIILPTLDRATTKFCLSRAQGISSGVSTSKYAAKSVPCIATQAVSCATSLDYVGQNARAHIEAKLNTRTLHGERSEDWPTMNSCNMLQKGYTHI
jgi:hypothetical protein